MPDDRKEPGDALAWSAADWNAWAAAAASAGGAAAGHGMGGPIGSSSGVLRDHTPRSTWARLAGTGSPYDWQEVVRDVAAGSWADGPGSGTASAVEINGAAGLAGTIQRITECGPGEWCFQAVRIGVAYVGPPPPCGTITVTVKRCNPALPMIGATYRVYDGPANTAAVLCTGTTDASGQFSCGYSSTKSYLVEVDPPSVRYRTGTVTIAATCPANYSPTLNMPASDDHVCTFACDDPISRTIYVTDPVAGLTIPCVCQANGYTWFFGCRQVTVSNARDANCLNPASRSVALGYELNPSTPGRGGPWTMRLTMSACVASNTGQPMVLSCASANPNTQFINSSFGSGAGTCPASSGTIAINMTGANAPLPSIYGTGTVNFPFSE